MSKTTGLGEERKNRTFLTVKGKEFILKAEQPTSKDEIAALLADGWKARDWETEDNSGTAYEKRFPSLTGKIIQVFEHDGKYAVEQKIVVEDEDGDTYQFSAKKYMNTQIENVMNRMCHDDFDPSKNVKLVPYKKPKENGNGWNEGIMIFNEDEKGRYASLVPKAFTVAEPGDCPSWDKKKVKGKIEWNNDATIEFLTQEVDKKFEDVTPAEESVEEEVPDNI